MRSALRTATLLLIPLSLTGLAAGGNGGRPDRPWRTLPLVTDGKVDGNWTHVGGGDFAVEDGGLRTECDEKGLGLLLYGREKFGDCQIRVVYRGKDARSNGGVFVRIDDGILRRMKDQPAPLTRNKEGELSRESLRKLMDASEREQGPWYAVHHGYEVQICDDSERTTARGPSTRSPGPPPCQGSGGPI